MSRLFLTEGDDAVCTALAGAVALDADRVVLNPAPLYVRTRHTAAARRVGIVSGGGSGHEPLHTGFVGEGGLDAAVPGGIFASPHNRQIYEASRTVARQDGVLHIVKNYTGDLINFGIAAQRLQQEGIPVGTVVVSDDIASGKEGTRTGRRGTGATVLVEKILGAAADEGLPLGELVALGESVVAASRSLAAATRAHTSPATGDTAFDIAETEVEYGVGIHGERAASTSPRTSPDVLVRTMIEELCASFETRPPHQVALLINGLGSATAIELSTVATLAIRALRASGVTVDIAAAGTFCPALDMHGFALTVMALPPEDDRLARWLTAPTGTAGLPRLTRVGALTEATMASSSPAEGVTEPPSTGILPDLLATVQRHHAALTRLDQQSGDGDFGDNLLFGLRRALIGVSPDSTPEEQLGALARVFLDDVGGTSGPLIGLLLSALHRALFADADGSADISRAAVLSGVREGARAIAAVGGAQVGDRTLIDALAPLVFALEHGEDVTAALSAAAEGAAATADMIPRRGRASYVGERARGDADPGAVGIVLLLGTCAPLLGGEFSDAARRVLDHALSGS